jgi:hypothetical protein
MWADNHEQWLNKKLEGDGRGPFKVESRHSTEETTENLSVAGNPSKTPTDVSQIRI